MQSCERLIFTLKRALARLRSLLIIIGQEENTDETEHQTAT